MKKILITIVASLMAALTVGAATPAAASNGWTSARVVPDPGGAYGQTAVKFLNARTVTFTRNTLTDLCKADGYSVYFKVEAFVAEGPNLVGVDVSPKKVSKAGCGVRTHPGDFSMSVAAPKRILGIQLRVCVDRPPYKFGDRCTLSLPRSNPYAKQLH